jgi:hypothetical protein
LSRYIKDQGWVAHPSHLASVDGIPPAGVPSFRVLGERWAAPAGLTGIVRMAEIVAGVAEDRAAVGEIVDAAGRVGKGTKNLLPRICADSHGYEKGHDFGCATERPPQSPSPPELPQGVLLPIGESPSPGFVVPGFSLSPILCGEL